MGVKRIFGKSPLAKYTARVRAETAKQHSEAVQQQRQALPVAATIAHLFETNHISELTRKSLFGS